MMNTITISKLQEYLKTKYDDPKYTNALFMKLVEEVGEVAEAINKIDGRKADDGLSSLSEELVDVIHYAIGIATINNINLEQVMIEKDKKASIKYNQYPNLEEYLDLNK
ncbi:MAG: MazG nucleotide pyrophosphohydrolase domain-containing protein [Erysipelothrix sp.]